MVYLSGGKQEVELDIEEIHQKLYDLDTNLVYHVDFVMFSLYQRAHMGAISNISWHFSQHFSTNKCVFTSRLQ